jgi:hypothetical protein
MSQPFTSTGPKKSLEGFRREEVIVQQKEFISKKPEMNREKKKM